MKLLSNVLAAMGLLALGYWAVELARARLYQVHERRRFAEGRREPPADTVPPTISPTTARPYPSSGSAIAMLTIPRLGMSAVVLEGAGERELKLGPGHIRGTALPGDGGNVGVASHRDTFFRPLRFIRTKDTIKVVAHKQEYLYEVVSTKIVTPDDIGVLYPTGREGLTLVTCYPFNFVGAAPKRFIVRADCLNCSR